MKKIPRDFFMRFYGEDCKSNAKVLRAEIKAAGFALERTVFRPMSVSMNIAAGGGIEMHLLFKTAEERDRFVADEEFKKRYAALASPMHGVLPVHMREPGQPAYKTFSNRVV